VAQLLRRHGDLAGQQQRHAVAELAEFEGLEPAAANHPTDRQNRRETQTSERVRPSHPPAPASSQGFEKPSPLHTTR
jgi:hypothetical protein